MALAKFGLVLAIFFITTHSQMVNQDVMESKHRAVGYHLRPTIHYARQQRPIYGLHHAQHLTPNPIGYGQSRRPSGSSHQVRPAHAIPHVHHLPAYRIPYPAHRQLPNYANQGPFTGTYPIPWALRPHVTPTTPRPSFMSPVNPARASYTAPNYVSLQAQGSLAYHPPPVGPAPTRAPFYPAAPTPLTTPRSSPTPSVGRSLLDLPWVKPLYARHQVAPKVNYYGTPNTWRRQEVKPAPIIVEQDTGVSISSAGSPTAGTSMTTLPSRAVNQNAGVRQIPQDAAALNVQAPVAVAQTQRPISAVTMSDDSDGDVRVIQEATTPIPLRQTPIILLEESNEDPVVQQIPLSGLRVSFPSPTPERPATSVEVLDSLDEDIQQEFPLSVVPADTSESTQPAAVPLSILDDSVEDIIVVQQVQVTNSPVTSPRPMTTATPLVANPVEGLVLRDTPKQITLSSLSGTSPGATRPQQQAISLSIADDSDEEILQQVLVPNVPIPAPQLTPTAPPAVSLVLLDDSGEDVEFRGTPQQGSGVLLSALNSGTRTTTQFPLISVSISDNSEEDFRFVQGVPVSNVPVSQSTETGTASFAVKNQGVPEPNVPVSQSETASLAAKNQQVPVPNVPVSQSTAGTASPSARNQAVPVSNVLVSSVSVSTPRSTMPGTASFVVLDTSDEEDVLQEVSRPLLSTPIEIGLLTVFDDSVEDVRIVQQVPVSNVQVPLPSMRPDVSFLVLDRSDEDVRLQNTPQAPTSLFSGSASGTTTLTPTLPFVVLDKSEEDLQIIRQSPLSNGSFLSSLTTIRENSLEVPDDSNEDLRLIPQAVSVPSLSSPGPPLSTTTPLILLVDSDEDVRTVQELRLLNVSSSGTVAETSLLFLRDSGEDIQISRRIPQPTISLSGLPQSSAAVPFMRIDDSAEDIQLTQEIRLPNIFSSGRTGERDSGEDIEISRRISQPTISLSGSLQSAAAGPLLRLVDSDEDIQIVQEIRLLNTSSGTVEETPLLFLRDSDEDIQISRRIPQPTISLPGSPQSAAAGPSVRLVDSVEDIQLLQKTRLPNTSSSGRTGESTLIFLRDSGEDIEISRRISQPTISLSGSLQSAAAGPLLRLVDSDEDIQIAQEIRLLNNSSGTVEETPLLFLRDSDEDIQISRRILQTTISLPGLEQSTGASSFVRVVDSDEDLQLARKVSLSVARSSTPVTPPGRSPIAFQVDSEEDIQIIQGNTLSNAPLNGLAPSNAGPLVLLVNSAEDSQEFLRTNVSLSSATTSRVVLVDSDEDIQSPGLPLLQAANRERELDNDQSDEDIRRRIAVSGGSIVFVNPTAP